MSANYLTALHLVVLSNLREEKTEYRGGRKCFDCAHVREVPGSCHIACAKPDPLVTGNPHGIKEGWFMYPINFDPIWMARECKNYEPANASPAVSHAVSHAEQ